ncbi:MAG: DUF433 domain-containing protein [Phycisphaerae bacterium]
MKDRHCRQRGTEFQRISGHVGVSPWHEPAHRDHPKVHFGKPCVKGTRIPVVNVLELVAEGLPFETIVRDC